ncbi:unnamed protein product [Ixodes pacificus]
MVPSATCMLLALQKDVLEKFQKEFLKDPKNRLAQNVCTKVDLKDVYLSHQTSTNVHHVVSHKHQFCFAWNSPEVSLV